MPTEQTPQQAKAYAAVRQSLIGEGYSDQPLETPQDVRETLAQMVLEAEQMMNRAERLQSQLTMADDDAECEAEG